MKTEHHNTLPNSNSLDSQRLTAKETVMTRSTFRILTALTLTTAVAACGATHEARPATPNAAHNYSMVADAPRCTPEGASPPRFVLTAATSSNLPLAEIVVEGRRLQDSQLAEIVIEGRRLQDSQLAEVVVEGRRLAPMTLAAIEVRANRLPRAASRTPASGEQVAALLD